MTSEFERLRDLALAGDPEAAAALHAAARAHLDVAVELAKPDGVTWTRQTPFTSQKIATLADPRGVDTASLVHFPPNIEPQSTIGPSYEGGAALVCPNCAATITTADAASKQQTARGLRFVDVPCHACGKIFTLDMTERDDHQG